MASPEGSLIMALHHLLGHEGARGDVLRAVQARTLPGALLLKGPRGIGKQRMALWIAQLMLCEQPTASGPCDGCRACKLSLRLEHPDVHWYFPLPRPTGAPTPEKMADALEEARHGRLAELREQSLQRPVVQFLEKKPVVEGIYLAAVRTLRRRANQRPSMGQEQIFIIGDAEALVPQEASPEAANALLKLLEEPPEATRFILTSSEPGSLLDTIRSRTVPLQLGPLEPGTVAAFLQEQLAIDADAALRAARLAQGSLGRAFGYLPDDEGNPGSLEQLRKAAVRLLVAALSPRPGDVFTEALGTGTTGGRAFVELLDALTVWLRDLAAIQCGQTAQVANHDAIEWLQKQGERTQVTAEACARALDRVEVAALQAAGNVNPQLIVAGLLHELRTILHATATAEPGVRA
jgi:DNA polymerase-3 subunit delta'